VPVYNKMQRWIAIGLLVAVIVIFSMVVIAPIVSKGMELHDTKETLVFISSSPEKGSQNQW
jgi:general secretion pathway protein M